MKPTQQEIIELAREASMTVLPDETLWWAVHQDELERFATLLLERFGAGGGEPSRDMPHGWVTNWPAPNGGTRPVYHASAIKPKYGPELDNSLVSYPVFTRPGPSPTNLRAEYLRGLEDAKAVAKAGYDAFWTRHEPEFPKTKYDQASVLRTMHATVEFVSTDIADAIEALKGKQ